MKVQVTFTVDVDWCDKPLGDVRADAGLARRVEKAVAEAVGNAVGYGEANGHTHAMAADIAILMDSFVVAKLVDE